jgi:hypothetical protein
LFLHGADSGGHHVLGLEYPYSVVCCSKKCNCMLHLSLPPHPVSHCQIRCVLLLYHCTTEAAVNSAFITDVATST